MSIDAIFLSSNFLKNRQTTDGDELRFAGLVNLPANGRSVRGSILVFHIWISRNLDHTIYIHYNIYSPCNIYIYKYRNVSTLLLDDLCLDLNLIQSSLIQFGLIDSSVIKSKS